MLEICVDLVESSELLVSSSECHPFCYEQLLVFGIRYCNKITLVLGVVNLTIELIIALAKIDQ